MWNTFKYSIFHGFRSTKRNDLAPNLAQLNDPYIEFSKAPSYKRIYSQVWLHQ